MSNMAFFFEFVLFFFWEVGNLHIILGSGSGGMADFLSIWLPGVIGVCLQNALFGRVQRMIIITLGHRRGREGRIHHCFACTSHTACVNNTRQPGK